jgi:hypothetical protein
MVKETSLATIISREARESAVLFEYLSDSARLAILGLLAAEGEMFVSQFYERLKMATVTISNQLRSLLIQWTC